MKKSIRVYFLPVLLATCFLSACVPVALVAAGAVAGGALIYDRRDVKTMTKDRDMSSTLLKQINDDAELRTQTHITIASFNNVLLVAGQASTPALRDRIFQMANSTPNLKRVYNEVSIEPPTSTSVQTSDYWITTKVKSKMLAEKGLTSSQIKVVTENKVVYLMGVVTHKQADLAADVASSVSGVTKVVRIFEYE
jgi:osmotically-inducible protein OsmY